MKFTLGFSLVLPLVTSQQHLFYLIFQSICIHHWRREEEEEDKEIPARNVTCAFGTKDYERKEWFTPAKFPFLILWFVILISGEGIIAVNSIIIWYLIIL